MESNWYRIRVEWLSRYAGKRCKVLLLKMPGFIKYVYYKVKYHVNRELIDLL